VVLVLPSGAKALEFEQVMNYMVRGFFMASRLAE